MVCPKCNNQIGELQICPECGASVTASATPKNKSKTIGMVVFTLLLGIMILAIISLTSSIATKDSTEPAETANWSVILSDYRNNQVTANKKYHNKKMIFYVRIKEIEDYGVEVSFLDEEWKDTGIRFFGNKVHFTDVSTIHRGDTYKIEGKFMKADYNGGDALDFVEISGAKIIE